MKIVREMLSRGRIEDFADQHELTMKVFERHAHSSPDRFYAHFDRVDVKEGSVLVGRFGDGATEDQAIADYANKISGAFLVYSAYTDARREMRAPIFC